MSMEKIYIYIYLVMCNTQIFFIIKYNIYKIIKMYCGIVWRCVNISFSFCTSSFVCSYWLFGSTYLQCKISTLFSLTCCEICQTACSWCVAAHELCTRTADSGVRLSRHVSPAAAPTPALLDVKYIMISLRMSVCIWCVYLVVSSLL